MDLNEWTEPTEKTPKKKEHMKLQKLFYFRSAIILVNFRYLYLPENVFQYICRQGVGAENNKQALLRLAVRGSELF